MINFGSFGEIGANPIRARRREAYIKHCWPDIPVHNDAVYKPEATIRGKAIGAYLRRPANKMPSRNILAVQVLFFITASASFMRK